MEHHNPIRIHVSIAVWRPAPEGQPAGRQFLFLQEADPRVLGLWNLPGGHLEYGETILACARREVLEETGLNVEPDGVLGVYTNLRLPELHAVRFVLLARDPSGVLAPGDDILSLAWRSPRDLARLPDESLISPPILRRVLEDLERQVSFPLALLREPGIS